MAQILDLGKLRFNWAGEYNSTTEYEYNDVVKYGPNVYAYVAPNSAIGIAPTNASRWLLVIEGVRYRGMYTADTLYYVNDLVSDEFSTYIVITEHTATSGNAAVPELTVIAVGQEGIPNQAGHSGNLLTTDGQTPQWTTTLNVNPLHVSADSGTEAIGFEATNGLTDVASIFTLGSEQFVQLAVANTQNGAEASTDIIAYTADGDNRSGWVDMGITSKDFDANTFGITGPHDGYIFMSAPRVDETVILARKTAASVAELETLDNHNYLVGQEIHVENVGTAYDGVRVITAITGAKKFEFASDIENEIRVLLNPYGSTYRPAGHGNLVLATDATGTQNKLVFAAGGFATGTSQMEITPNEVVDITITTESTGVDSGALVVAGGVGLAKDLHVGGSLHTFGSVDFENADQITFGPGSQAFHETLTHPTLTITEDAPDYAQVAFKNFNSSANASTDYIAYASNGDDNSGYIDMGITSETFTDPQFTITGKNDGYIFMVAPEGTEGEGNLVLATGETGTANKIVFAAGGLATNNTQMEIVPDSHVRIAINTPSTSATTGALVVQGGVGITGDVNIAGNIVFGGEGTQVGSANLAVSDPMIFVGNESTSTDNDLAFVGEGKFVIPDTYTRTIINKALAADVATLTFNTPYTTAAHDWVVGDTVVISGVDSTFDGSYTITALPTSTTISYAKVHADVPSAPVGDNARTVTNKELLGGIATITTSSSHNFTTGQTVVVAGVDSTFNGTYTIASTPTSATFTYAKSAANVTSTAATGTATVNVSTATAVVTNPVRTRWTAWSKDAFDGVWKLSSNIRVKPTTQIDYTQSDIAYDSIKIQNASLLGNLAVSGNTTITGTANIVNNLSIATNKFTVDAATGNTVTAGTLDVAGYFKVNGTKFYVDAATGNTTAAGTLSVTGAVTASSTAAIAGNLSVNTNKFTVASATGNTTVAGTLAVTGGTALTSDLAVNTNKFTVAAATGNTVVAGTLQVAGAVTSTSNITISATPSADTDAATVAVVKQLAGGAWLTKTANYTAASGELIFADSSTNSFIITLPATPAANAKVRIHDVASKWHVNPVTVARNGSTIMGLTEDLLLNVKNATVDLVYSNATNGWRIL